jgi:uncharacterized protein
MADLETPVASSSGLSIADPAPLGLAGFALTTFLLSAANADLTRGPGGLGGAAWLGYALAYGGLAQLLAGMWEFKRGNTFGATAFGSYGAFWIGLYFWATKAAGATENNHNDLGWILLAFAIFNLYMLICAARVNTAVFLVFLALEATEIVLAIGFLSLSPTAFQNHNSIIHIGGYLGILTALLAWYASFAGVKASVGGRLQLPVGGPMDI